MKDFLIVSKGFFKDFKKYAKGIPVLFLSIILYFLILSLFNNLTRTIGGNLFFGFVRWLIYLNILTHFASLMRLLFSMEKLELSDLTTYDSNLLGPLSQIAFLFWMIDLVLGLFPFTLRLSPVYIVLYGIWEIYRAPAYESVYIGENSMAEVFPSINRLWKDAPISMLVFFAIVFLIRHFVGKSIFIRAQYFDMGTIGFILLNAALITLYLYAKGIFCRILLFSNKHGRAFKEKVNNAV